MQRCFNSNIPIFRQIPPRVCTLVLFINPLRACAARVTAVVLFRTCSYIPAEYVFKDTFAESWHLESMLFYAIILYYALLEVVHGQYPRFELKGSILDNNSFVNRRTIGTGNDALKCVTNNTACCTDPHVGDWTDPADAAVHQGMNEGYDLYVTRRDEVVTLNRRSLGVPGMWRCSIPDSSGVMQYIYIYTGSPPGFSADG